MASFLSCVLDFGRRVRGQVTSGDPEGAWVGCEVKVWPWAWEHFPRRVLWDRVYEAEPRCMMGEDGVKECKEE